MSDCAEWNRPYRVNHFDIVPEGQICAVCGERFLKDEERWVIPIFCHHCGEFSRAPVHVRCVPISVTPPEDANWLRKLLYRLYKDRQTISLEEGAACVVHGCQRCDVHYMSDYQIDRSYLTYINLILQLEKGLHESLEELPTAHVLKMLDEAWEFRQETEAELVDFMGQVNLDADETTEERRELGRTFNEKDKALVKEYHRASLMTKDQYDEAWRRMKQRMDKEREERAKREAERLRLRTPHEEIPEPLEKGTVDMAEKREDWAARNEESAEALRVRLAELDRNMTESLANPQGLIAMTKDRVNVHISSLRTICRQLGICDVLPSEDMLNPDGERAIPEGEGPLGCTMNDFIQGGFRGIFLALEDCRSLTQRIGEELQRVRDSLEGD